VWERGENMMMAIGFMIGIPIGLKLADWLYKRGLL
jgi:hypothetical protein